MRGPEDGCSLGKPERKREQATVMSWQGVGVIHSSYEALVMRGDPAMSRGAGKSGGEGITAWCLGERWLDKGQLARKQGEPAGRRPVS